FVPNQGDGWTLSLEELSRYYENCVTAAWPEGVTLSEDLVELAKSEPSVLARDHVGLALESAAMLGRRTAQMHMAVAPPTDNPSFTPEPVTEADVQSLLSNLRREALRVLELLKDSVATLPDEFIDLAGLVLGRRNDIFASFKLEAEDETLGERI